MRRLTGFNEIPTPPGLVILPIDPALGNRVQILQASAAPRWVQAELAPALEHIDRESHSVVVLAPPDPAQVTELVKALRGRWHRQLVPLVVILPEGQEHVVVAAYAGGADFVVTPDITDDVMRARGKALARLRMLTALLVESRDRAKVRLESQTEWTHFLIEDMRDPLDVLSTGLDGLRSADGLQEEDRALCDQLGHELRRMSSLVNDLLDYQRFGSGELRPTRQPIDAAALVQKVVARLERVAKGRRLTFRVAVKPGDAAVEADLSLVERVIDNLLSNALRYAPAGDVIDVEVAPAGRALSLSVLNGGPPIPVEMREKIFEPYVRLSGNAPVGAGGLGLAFCRAALGAHGGNIHLTERDGRTCFVAVLPR